jgi:PPM family protein phosphatase
MAESTDMLTAEDEQEKAQSVDVPFTFVRYSNPHEEHPERNEDYILVDAQRGLAAVFDGVGGNEGGGMAARVAARTIQRHWKHVLKQAQTGLTLVKMREGLDMQAVLKHLVIAANDYVRIAGYRGIKADGAPLSMGTTVVLAVFCRQEEDAGYLMTYAHVGDSRIYLLRSDEKLRRLTSDDGYFRILLKDEKIVEEDIWHIDQATRAEDLTETEKGYFDKRNGITQSLGEQKRLDVHVDQVALEDGDRILFCSDGVHDNLIDLEIEETLRRGGRTGAAKMLVQRAIERSHEENALRAKKDDMSALVVTCHF